MKSDWFCVFNVYSISTIRLTLSFYCGGQLQATETEMSTYNIRVATMKLNDTKTRFKLPVFIQVFVAKPSGIKRFGNREYTVWNGTTLANNKYLTERRRCDGLLMDALFGWAYTSKGTV